jgi:hypothetical protein
MIIYKSNDDIITFSTLPSELNLLFDSFIFRHSFMHWKKKYSKIITFFRSGYIKPRIIRSYYELGGKITHVKLSRI